jgi:hypothetical protein
MGKRTYERTPRGYGGFDTMSSMARPTGPILNVSNLSQMDLDVHVMHDGDSHRLGRIMRNQSYDFEIPLCASLTGPFLLVVQPVGTVRGYMGPELSALPGDRIEWPIAPSVAATTFAHRGL